MGVCQGYSLTASFFILTSASRSPSAIAELLVLHARDPLESEIATVACLNYFK